MPAPEIFKAFFWFALASAPATAKQDLDLENLKLLSATVFYCHDGDTCRLKIESGMWMNVRLAGIDAPEVAHGKKKQGQPFGAEARDFLTGLVKAKKISVRQTDLDQFNRPVVELLTEDGTNINRRLIQSGLAEVYRGKTPRLDTGPYLADEEAAKKAGLGIWSQKQYVSPSQWRKGKTTP